MQLPATVVREQQRNWAIRHHVDLDTSGYTLDLSDNLFTAMSLAVRTEFEEADGDELGRSGKKAKIQALHSSSALACNVFDHWRNRDASVLADALGLEAPLKITFERKFPTGLPGNAPNIDVVIVPRSGPMLAIECKFLEPYGTHVRGFKEKYFKGALPGLWIRAGFPRAQALAESINSGGHSFNRLYAEQLLKHILGLARSGLTWRLAYLWYDVPGLAGAEHSAEIESFAQVMSGDGIDFVALSYQKLFEELDRRAKGDDRLYIDYLRDRYFGRTV